MKPIILLRGLGREIKHWDEEFLNLLRRHQFEPILMDLPGAGNYRNVLSPLEIEDYVAFLQTRFEELYDGGEKVYLLGHSLGGMVALRWAFEFPENFHKVFLVNTSDKRSRSLPERLRPFGLKKMFAVLKNKELQEKEKAILDMVSNNKPAKKRAYNQWLELACLRPIKPVSLVNQFVAASKFLAPSHIEVPLVYISSRGDKMVSYKCSEKLAKQHQAKVMCHESAGHDIPLDAPHWLVDCLSQCTEVDEPSRAYQSR